MAEGYINNVNENNVVTITITSTSIDIQHAYARRVGNVVYVYGALHFTSALPTSDTKIGSLDAKLKSPGHTNWTIQKTENDSGTTVSYGYLGVDGEGNIYVRQGGSSDTRWLYCHSSFLCR